MTEKREGILIVDDEEGSGGFSARSFQARAMSVRKQLMRSKLWKS